MEKQNFSENTFILLFVTFLLNIISLPALWAQPGYPDIDTIALKAFYTFNGSFNDSTGNNIALFPNNVILTDDRFCHSQMSALIPDTDSYLFVDDDKSLDFADQLSVSFWIYIDSLPDSETRIISKSDPSDPDSGSYWVSIYPGEENLGGSPWSFSFTDNHGEVHTFRSDFGIIPGSWMNYYITFDGSTVTMYNGEEPAGIFDNVTGSIRPNDAPLILGNVSGSGFTGMLDDVLLYDRLMQPDEISRLFRHSIIEPGPFQTNIFAFLGERVELIGPQTGSFLNYKFTSSEKSEVLQDGPDSICWVRPETLEDFSRVYFCQANNCRDTSTAIFLIIQDPEDTLIEIRKTFPQPDTAGLKAYYAFAGDFSDSTGNTGPASAFSVHADSGIFGHPEQALRFPAYGGTLVIPDDPDLDITDDFTVLLSLRIDTLPEEVVPLMKKGEGTADSIGNYGLFIDPELRLLFALTASDGTVYTHINENTIQPGTWYIITATYDGTELNTFIDDIPGIPLTTAGISLKTNNDPLTFGTIGPESGAFLIDDFRFYNRAWDPVEIGRFFREHLPLIYDVPWTSEACPGAIVEFEPHASGPFLNFTFLHENEVIQEGESPLCENLITTEADLGNYQCIISNGYRSGFLELNIDPKKLYDKHFYIYDVPETQVFFTEGDEIDLSFYVNDNQPGLVYELYHNDQIIPNTYQGYYAIGNATSADAGTYYLVVLNGCERITSDTVHLIPKEQTYTENEVDGWDWTGNISGSGTSYFSSISLGTDGSFCLLGHFTGGLKVEGEEVFSSVTDDIFIVKYAENGEYLWSRFLTSPYGKGKGDLAVDSHGNVYVVGSFSDILHIDDQELSSDVIRSGYMAKYSPSGVLIWIKKFETTRVMNCDNILIDSADHIFLGGNFSGTLQIDSFEVSGSWDEYATVMFLARMDTAGTCQWISHAVTDANMLIGFGLIDMELNSSGGIITNGTFTGQTDFGNNIILSTSVEAPFLVKFNQEGIAQWGTTIDPGTGFAEAFDVSIDNGDRIFMTGMYLNDIAFGDHSIVNEENLMEEIFLARFSAEGICTNLSAYGSTGDGGDFGLCYEPISDSAGYLLGVFGDTLIMVGDTLISTAPSGIGSSASNTFIARLTDEGEPLAVKSTGVRGNRHTGEICVTDDGRLYFAGLNEQTSLKKSTASVASVAFVGFLEKGITESEDTIYVTISENVSICAGDSILFRDNWYHEDGTYVDTVTSLSPADTIYILNLSVDICSSLENNMTEGDYMIYPNPGHQFIDVRSCGSIPFDLQLFEMSGKLLLRQSNRIEYHLSVLRYQPGIYFLRLVRSGSTSVYKIVIQ